MATIVVNDVDPMHQMQLKSELLRQGHIAWLADDLGTVNALLNDVPINLMILDLDKENLEDLMQFANRWQGVKILFQGSGSSITTDFRMWMADEYISKRENRRRFSTTINRLLHKSSQNMQGDYEEDQV